MNNVKQALGAMEAQDSADAEDVLRIHAIILRLQNPSPMVPTKIITLRLKAAKFLLAGVKSILECTHDPSSMSNQP